MIAFRGQKEVGTPPDWSPSGVFQNVRPFHMGVPQRF